MLRKIRLFRLKKFKPVKVGDSFFTVQATLGCKHMSGVMMFDDVRLTCLSVGPKLRFRVDAEQLAPPGPEVWKEVCEPRDFDRDDFYNLILDGIVRTTR